VHIDDPVFRLFSKVTVGSLFLFAGLVTVTGLLGEKLQCILPPKEDIQQNALNQYCFIMSTYTVPKLYNKTLGVEIAHPGVGPHTPMHDEQKYHYYYQWVPVVLFFQAWSFYLTHVLWRVFDGQRVKTICELEVAPTFKITMKEKGFVPEDETDKKQHQKAINKAAVYFVGHISYNRAYSVVFILCEILNFVMVLLNFWFTNYYLSNAFHNYGPRALGFLNGDPDSEDNPMNEVFPKVAKCDFHKYGPSGNIVRYDIMCVLALNIINEKIYFFLWFWFVILSIIGGLQLVFRAMLLFIPRLRRVLLRRYVSSKFRRSIDMILDSTDYSEWFLLKILAMNIDSIRFGELCEHICKLLHRKTANGRMTSVSPTMSFEKNNPDDEVDKSLMH